MEISEYALGGEWLTVVAFIRPQPRVRVTPSLPRCPGHVSLSPD